MNRKNCRFMKKGMALLLSIMLILPCLPIKAGGVTNTAIFSDIAASWAKNEIQYFAEKGWMKGYPEGTFRPEQQITRAEFSAIINNVFNYTEAAAQCPFSDVDAASWYYQVVLIAAQQGYIKGYPDQTFKPDANISRYEAAVIIARLLNMDNRDYQSEIWYFADARDIPEWAGGGVGSLAAQKIIVGYPDGTFSGANYLTRAETVALVRRAHDIVSNPAEKEIPPKGKNKTKPIVGGPLSLNWVENAQASMTNFVAGAELELEIICNEEAEITWSVTQGDLLGKLTSTKVWWRLPDNAGKYTVTVTVQKGKESKSLSRTVKVIPYMPSGDTITNITALNGGVAPIMSYDATVGIPSMIIGRYSPKKIYTAEDAIDSLNDIKELMNIENPEEEFKILKTENRNNVISYTLLQVYRGIPVVEGYYVIDVDSNSNIKSLVGSYYPDVRLSELSVVPAINESTAQAIVGNNLLEMDDYSEESPEFISSILIIDMVHSENPELAWGIGVNIGGETWEYYIHAQSGKIIDKYSMSPFFMEEDTTSEWQDDKVKEKINVVKVTETNDKLYYVLHDRKRKIQIFDMKMMGMFYKYMLDFLSWPGEKIIDDNNNWDEKKDLTDERKDALYALTRFSKVYDFSSKMLGRNSIDGNGKEIIVSINVGEFKLVDHANAYWVPSKEQFIIGSKGNFAKAYDVIGHEYTHAIAHYGIQDSTGKGFKRTDYSESAAISEAISDVLGALIEASIKGYSVGDDNFYRLAEDSGRIIRDMSAAKVNHCAKFITTGNADKAIYSNSGILSTAFYKMTSGSGGMKDIELLTHIWYDTLLGLRPNATFKHCREEFCRNAYKYRQQDTELDEKKYSISNEQIEAVKKAFDDVGIIDDVSDTAWYASVIKKAKDKKIIFGYTDGNIKPENTVTRAEFLAMAMRASKITTPVEQAVDDKIASHWAGAEVTFAVQQKWVSDSWLNNTYIEESITRAEACNVAFRVMNTQHQLTRVQLYKYVNGQRSEKGEIWETAKFNDFASGLNIVPRDDQTQLTRAAQEKLNWQGYRLEADGLFGNDTINAVRAFQKEAGLKQTGMIDDLTWEVLNYFGMYQLFINGCIEGTLDDDVLYLAPWRNLNRAEACKILISPLD